MIAPPHTVRSFGPMRAPSPNTIDFGIRVRAWLIFMGGSGSVPGRWSEGYGQSSVVSCLIERLVIVKTKTKGNQESHVVNLPIWALWTQGRCPFYYA